MTEVVVKWCPYLPKTYTPACYAPSSTTDPAPFYRAGSETSFSRCIENLCAAYKDGECKVFNTSVYLPVEHRE